jgi:D-alanyl-D-alanine carboxypeptidase
MSIISLAAVFVGCLLASNQSDDCLKEKMVLANASAVAGIADGRISPIKTGESIDVLLSAKAVLVWDEETGVILYAKNPDSSRPVASLSKLVSALTVRKYLPLDTMVTIPPEVLMAQKLGANIKLPAGDAATAYDLLAAGLIASANDAMVSLAIGLSGSEDEFVRTANDFIKRNGIYSTKISNATGLAGGEQYSTARDIKELFRLAYRDKVLRNFLVSEDSVLTTQGGSSRKYKSTNKLLGTYFPVLAAKTGYTNEAGENLVVMTYGNKGQRIGAVVLGSEDRFQDIKTVVEWVQRSYEWP